LKMEPDEMTAVRRRLPGHSWLSAALLVAFLAIADQAVAQDDGPRVYQLAPEGAKAVTVFAVAKRGNEGPEPGSLYLGSNIDTKLVIFRYVQTLEVAGRQFSPFLIVPVGRVEIRDQPQGHASSDSSSGLGDIQIGGTLGLVGSPVMTPEVYGRYQPRLRVALLGRVFFPTGAYSAKNRVNFGSNRVSVQVGLPMTVVSGTSYLDPALTTFEVLPTVTFYEVNSDPYGARKSSKAALYSVESHLTHNFGPRWWLSADVLYRYGGETTTDGAGDANTMRGWSAGGSAALVLDRRATLILTYEEVIARRDQGPTGWFFRTALVLPF
jgi:hypothetical protein